jgi:prepilin-type processing-associated H-X9-DG protein
MRSARFTCVDVVALTLVAGSLATLLGAAAVSRREIENRIRCASNLRQIGTAIILYANENRGAYPRTTYKADAAPVWGTPYPDDGKDVAPVKESNPFADEKDAPKEVLAVKPKPNDVTAPLFLLLRTQDIVPEVFVCPSTRLKRFGYDAKGAGSQEYTNFPGKAALAAHLSYSYQNPYPTPKAIAAGFKLNNSITAEFAVMADMNPGGEAVTTVTKASPQAEMRKANSNNHKGDGQNVLFGDGHVEFSQNPFVGVQRDNIYTANGPEEARRGAGGAEQAKAAIVAPPVDANDSILLPTAADIGQTPQADLPIEPGDVASLQKDLLGTFGSRHEGRPAVLNVDEKQMKVVSGPTTVTVNYKVLGTRGSATVIELSAEGMETSRAEVKRTPSTILIDGEVEALNNAWVRRP